MGTTIKELILEDLPDLEKIHFYSNFIDEKAGKPVYWESLPLTGIRLKNLPKMTSLDLNDGSPHIESSQILSSIRL
jgi:hypothetical protein